jgi:HK97 gp10 family phage protein
MTTIKIDDGKLKQLIADAPELVDKAVRATAFSVLGAAVGMPGFPVDTGATRNSGFVETSQGSGYDAAAGSAQGKRPGVETTNATPGKPPVGTAYVSFATNYAIWLELGTSRMPARPFLGPAVEQADEYFAKAAAKVFPE